MLNIVTEVGTSAPPSAPHTGAEPHFRCGIDGSEPAEKKVRNGG